MSHIDDKFLADNIAAYDATAKSILSHKVFLARILKRCVREFADTSPEEIAEKYIEGEPDVGKVPLATDRTNAVRKIKGDNVEYNTVTEGETLFDMVFTAYAPTTGEPIKLIVNVEAQRKAKPGYSLIKRGIFHGSRLMSAQYDVEFSEPDFDGIKKVISIWICMNSPKTIGSGITEYHFTEQPMLGSILNEKQDYDLMQMVMVYVGKDADSIEDELLRLLHLIFRAKLDATAKKERLRDEFDIELDNEVLKEVNIMCNLGEGLVEETREETTIEMTANMLREKIPMEIISRVTKLSADKIAEIGKLHGCL